ncbi:DUF1353 domain-containing protein [Spirosoma terrae]|uniref:DUF1353 domain-containing protein n=1 Tax=Spirosoma terrae TaxID=1968276 RepID=A0A6L9LA69_9BACT|nr:DUF1353 domain-containing protein [Spirosoma terrae]NDU95703.1 DUF1353 domain-containing protein [Spirosoma terrae]
MTPILPRYVAVQYPTYTEDRQGQSRQCFWLVESLVITLSTGLTLTIPAGFCTDFASVPKLLWWIFPPVGDHILADVVHDYLYASHLLSRADADREFLLLMKHLRPLPRSWVDNHLRYLAVRIFGRGPYARMGQLKR